MLKKFIVAILMAVSFISVGCTSEMPRSQQGDDGSLPDPVELVEQMNGDWIVESIDSADPVPLGRQLLLRVEVGEGGSALTLGFEGCSRYGGTVERLSPVASTSTTVAGVGDCGAEDAVARELLRGLAGAQFRVLSPLAAEFRTNDLRVSLRRAS